MTSEQDSASNPEDSDSIGFDSGDIEVTPLSSPPWATGTLRGRSSSQDGVLRRVLPLGAAGK
jgi:hypothetical protein